MEFSIEKHSIHYRTSHNVGVFRRQRIYANIEKGKTTNDEKIEMNFNKHI